MGQRGKRDHYITAFFAYLIALCLASCQPGSAFNVVTPTPILLPTLMVLPSSTPTPHPTDTTTPELYLTAVVHMTATEQAAINDTMTAVFSIPTETETPTPTLSPTIDTISTQLAQIVATNEAAQRTIEALQAQLAAPPAPTDTPSITTTNAPTATITRTPSPSWTWTPSHTLDPVIPMSATILYTQQPAEIYSCASRTCNLVTQLSVGAAVIADGTIYSETVDTGNSLWYRLNYNGAAAYIYSGRVMIQPPTTVPPVIILPEVTAQVAPPIGMPAVCPRNCTEAVAWGLTAQQAAACGLDRDHDGVACYGD